MGMGMEMGKGMGMGSSHPTEDKVSLPGGASQVLSWISLRMEIQIPDS